MKKILLLIALLVSALTFAQNNGITYQAVIYSTNGEAIPGIQNPNSPLVNKAICLKFSVIDSNTQTEYQEKVAVTTDSFGMVNLVIGNGTQSGGYASSFNTIVWSNSKKYLEVSVDQTGNCNSFEEISNQLLTYVPFALAADSAASVSGIVGIANGGTNATTVVGAKTNLQLQNVDNTSDINKPLSTATQTALNTKVDKVIGKELSTNDYTTVEKTKLAAITGTNTGDQDLSSFATTTSVALKANTADVTSDLATKVDKVTGKELSSNDYTTAEKTKLAAITGTNTGDQDLSSLATNVALATKVDKVTGKDLSTNDYTTVEKTKLAAITGTNTGDQDLSSLATNVALATKVDKVAGKELSSNDYTTVEKTKLAAITGTNTGDQDLSSYATTTSVALKANTADVTTDLSTKVDKVAGKELSSNDYTTVEKAKLAAITGTNTGDQDLSLYATTTSVDLKANTADVNTNLATKVDKVTGKNLSTNDYTTAEKTKLASISGVNTGDQDLSSFVPFNGAQRALNLGNNNLQANQVTTNNLSVGSVNGMAIGMKGTGETNILGSSSMAYASGGFANTGFGHLTLSEIQGDENTALGSQAMRSSTTGSRNTAVGRASLNGNLSGNNNTALGYNTRVSANNLSNITAIGANAIVGTSNTIQLGDTNVTSVKTSGKLTTGTITLPNTDGTSGQVLSTNGSGVISWTSPSSVNTSNLVDLTTNQTIAGNKTLSGITTLSNTTASTSTSNGALIVTGGTGIGGKLNVGGITTVSNSTASTSTTSGALVVAGGTGITGNINIGGNETVSGSLGIGTSSVNSSAALEVNSTTQGILFPRVTLAQRDLIVSPAKGLVVMCLDCGQTGGELGELQVFNGSRWTNSVGTDASGVSAGVSSPAIGSSFQGGKVAYILTPSDPGYESGKVKGIIAATQDLSTSRLRLNNGTYNYSIQNGNSAIGTGLNNTNLLYAAYGTSNTTTSPSYLAFNYSILEGGVTYDDWFIPSKDELYKLYLNKAAIGNFSETGTTEAVYWSSNYCNGNSGAGQYVRFTDGFISCNGTENSYRVRLVRYFTIEGKTSLTADTFNGDLNGNATTATNVTGVVAIVNGGTGATTATGSINALLPSQASANGKVLTSDGTNVSWSSPGGNSHYVGESYGGGIVFYTYDNGAHGLIVATSEIGDLGPESSSSTTGIAFGGNGIWTGAYRYGVGGGLENTNVIISKNSNTGTQYFNYSRTTSTLYAALTASQYLPGGTQSMYYGDWYLPSKGELELLWNNRLLISGSGYNSAHEYWSSTETNESYAYKMQTNGGVGWTQKTSLCFVLPIRKF